MRFVNQVWNGEGVADQVARTALFPFEMLYRGIVSARSSLYDRSVLEVVESTIPVISVGNLTVGGTGKTPIASWIAKKIAAEGGRPAIVLRGYGGDEILVHRALMPGIEVIAETDRAEGIRKAGASGATVAILDDAFQHRRASRHADVVVVSADAWTGRTRLLPAGPWREPFSSIRRATIAVISRKAATQEKVAEVGRAISRIAPNLPRASVRLRMAECIVFGDDSRRMKVDALAGKPILSVSAIGDPGAFNTQLARLGGVVESVEFPDHHPFTHEDVTRVVAESRRHEMVVCTLKDAVKLGPLWPASAPPLWYVSQSIDVEHGLDAIDNVLAPFLASS